MDFVVMPEHVHLLVSEPRRGTIANAMQVTENLFGEAGKAGQRGAALLPPLV